MVPNAEATLTLGDAVRFRSPQTADEARERFYVVEMRGDRVLVEDADPYWRGVRPTFVYALADLEPTQ